jgi:hypothetical protein
MVSPLLAPEVKATEITPLAPKVTSPALKYLPSKEVADTPGASVAVGQALRSAYQVAISVCTPAVALKPSVACARAT